MIFLLIVGCFLVFTTNVGAYFLGHANGVADEKANSQLLRELDAE